MSPYSLQSLRILLPDGNFRHTLKVVRGLARSPLAPDVSIHVCTGESIPRPLRFSRHIEQIHPLSDGLSERDRARAIADVAAKIEADLLFPMSVGEALLVVRHRDVFGGLPVIPLSDDTTQLIAGDKGRLVRLMEAHGISHPPAIPLHPRSTLRERLEKLSFPVLVKATIGEGGHQIYRFEDVASLLQFAAEVPSGKREYLVQSFVEGTDIDMSVLALEGQVVAFTVQEGIGREENNGAFTPPEFIAFLDDPRVEALGRSLIEVLQFSGLAHIDFRYDVARSTLYVLEINTRVWGSLLGSLRAGINFPELACRIALGESVSPPEYKNIQYTVGDLALKRVGRALRRGIPLRNSCMAYGISDPLPDLSEFVRLKWERIKALRPRDTSRTDAEENSRFEEGTSSAPADENPTGDSVGVADKEQPLSSRDAP